jgi:hypothetical protein
MMERDLKPRMDWVDDWRVGTDPTRELELSRALVETFREFWLVEGLDERSESTRRRYSGGLHPLGGYLVSQGVDPDHVGSSARELLWEAVALDEGPLIFQDNEAWQEELDRACRKLRRYLEKTTWRR